MKRMILILSLTVLAACTTISAQTPTVDPTPEQPSAETLSRLGHLIDFARTDIQNALDSATADKDDVGIQCHTAGLALVNSVNLSDQKVIGVASAAQALRHTKRSVLQILPKVEEVKDKCAAVYNVGTVFKPILDVVGLKAVLP